MPVMAYLSLYRKYRPQRFSEILGQAHVSQTLANAITDDRVAHAYLFTGPRGTGKTSTARILAKALNCERGPTPDPCGVCDACIQIAEGTSLDVFEMDAASHSGVDDTREILAGVPLATAGGRKKVYVIDEVHMLTTQSFNALLKTLEEPPGHVVFVLATTEAHKVLPTIVSRTQRFDFRRISAEILGEHLTHVAKLEGIDIEPDAVGHIASHAEGSARDALAALEQLASFGGTITLDAAERMLGRRAEDTFFETFDAIAAGDMGGVFRCIQTFVAQGADLRQLAFDALEHTRSLLLLKAAPESEDLLDVPAEDRPRLASQAMQFTPTTLLRTLDLLGQAIIEMRNAPNHRLLLEVALVRAAAPDTDPSASGLLGRIERLERRIGIEGTPTSASAPSGDASAPLLQTASESSLRETPSSSPSEKKPTSKPSRAKKKGAAETAPTAPVAPVVPAPPADASGVGLSHLRDAWPGVMKEVNKVSKRVGGFLHSSRPLTFEDGTLLVEVQFEFHAKTMSDVANADILRNAIHAALGIAPQLAFAERGSAVPVETESAEEPEPEPNIAEIADAAPIEATEHDPVELVKRGLGAEIVEEREADR
jgi:DNA polymerase-3 subunit gamma/tau